jgi:hypothetical protein
MYLTMSKTALAREFGIQFTNPERKALPAKRYTLPPPIVKTKDLQHDYA